MCACVRSCHTPIGSEWFRLDVHVKSVNFGCVTGPQCGRDLYGSAAGSAARLCCAKYMCDLRFVSLFCFVWPRVSESDAKYVTVYSANTHTHTLYAYARNGSIFHGRENTDKHCVHTIAAKSKVVIGIENPVAQMPFGTIIGLPCGLRAVRNSCCTMLGWSARQAGCVHACVLLSLMG